MKKTGLLIATFLLLSFVGCSAQNAVSSDSVYQSKKESTTGLENQSIVDTSVESFSEGEKEQPPLSETVVKTNEETTKQTKQKEIEKQIEKTSDLTTKKEIFDSSETFSNIDTKYIVYQKTESGLLLTVKIPQKVGVGQKFVAYATVKNVSDSTINYALSSSSESKPKINLSIGANGKSFTNIDTYGKAFTNDVVYKQLKPDEELNVIYNLCPGKVNGSSITDSNWCYHPCGKYFGTAEFNFGGLNSKQANTQKITVDFSVEVVQL